MAQRTAARAPEETAPRRGLLRGTGTRATSSPATSVEVAKGSFSAMPAGGVGAEVS